LRFIKIYGTTGGMADVILQTDTLPNAPSISVSAWKWVGLNQTDAQGAPLSISGLTDRSVSITGTFGGATVVIEGSNDGTNYFTLNDLQASAISKTSAALEGIAEIAKFIRPRISAGASGTTNVNVHIVAVGKP